MAVEASLTGHLVLSTLHTNSAPETVTRLLDMGMDPFNFADSLLARAGAAPGAPPVQRSAAPAGRRRDERGRRAARRLPARLRRGRPAGRRATTCCAGWIAALRPRRPAACCTTRRAASTATTPASRGRAGLHELMVVSRELRRLIQTGARAEALQRHRDARRHAHAAPGRHREGAGRRDHHRRSAGDQQRLRSLGGGLGGLRSARCGPSSQRRVERTRRTGGCVPLMSSGPAARVLPLYFAPHNPQHAATAPPRYSPPPCADGAGLGR